MKLLIFLLAGLLTLGGLQKPDDGPAGARVVYRAELGVREATGRNDGSRVEEYLRYVGLKKGQPWCAAFVCWALGKAGIDNPRSGYCPRLFDHDVVVWERRRGAEQNPISEDDRAAAKMRGSDAPGLLSAGRLFSATTWDEGRSAAPVLRSRKIAFEAETVEKGAPVADSTLVFGLYYPEKGRIAHVGFVDAVEGKYLITVEGNTNEGGSREGDGVYCKRRLISSVFRIACYKKRLCATPKGRNEG